jgi:Flp pilus assembly pilin Flp
MAKQARFKGTVGAALVEYALIVALIVVPTIGAASYLTTQAKTQTVNQANCISTRPPPASCQIRAITTTTSTVPASTTTTTAPPPTSSTTAPPAGTAAWNVAASTFNSGTRVITLNLTVKANPGNTPVAGAIVIFRMTITPGGQSFAASCTSDASGVCVATWPVGVGVTQVVGTVDSIQSTPATSIVPGALTWATT